MTTKAERDEWRAISGEVYACAVSWECDVRLLGNVTAKRVASLTAAVPALLDENERLREALRVIVNARAEQMKTARLGYFAISEASALYVAIDEARALLKVE